jgi:apolipoprotein N-acyltransferase
MLVIRAAPTRREAIVRTWWGLTAFQMVVQYWLAPNLGPGLLVCSLILGALWLPWGWAVHRFLAAPLPLTGRRIGAALVVAPSAWICAEAARSWDSLGGPWALLGATQWKQPAMLASASLGGVWLTGFLIALVNTALTIAVLDVRIRTRTGVLVTAVACIVVGPVWSAIRAPLHVTRTISVAIVQPGVQRTPADQQAFEENATAALAGTQHLDLVVWGESSVSDDITNNPSLTGTFPDLVRSVGADLLVNGRSTPPGASGSYNETVLISPDGIVGRYDKMRLVPFGEYIPLRPALAWLTDVSKAAPENRIRGTSTVVMQAGSLTIGPLICFESAFPDLARSEVAQGADLLVYQTNNSTFQGSWAQPQHASLAAVRAAETGRPVVHTGLTGDSAVFDARGNQLAWRPGSYRGAFVTDIPLVSGKTIYDRTGDWLLDASFATLGIALLYEVVGSRAVKAWRRKRVEQGAP